jgi:hypothetical protein
MRAKRVIKRDALRVSTGYTGKEGSGAYIASGYRELSYVDFMYRAFE